jgi:hypothetical protein
MKTFLNFINENKEKNKGYFIDKDGYANPSEPIVVNKNKNRKVKKKEVKEEESITRPSVLNDLPGQKHGHQDEQDDHHNEISHKLHSVQDLPAPRYWSKHLSNIHGWTKDSSDISSALIQNHKYNKSPNEGMSTYHYSIHDTISKLANNPIGHRVHLYSGVSFDPKEAVEKSKDKILHLPAHISASHSVNVSKDFAARRNYDTRTRGNIIHIDAKASDKGFHVGHHSQYPEEHETIIPAGTKLKYSHTTDHKDDEYKDYSVHHFTIHSQK